MVKQAGVMIALLMLGVRFADAQTNAQAFGQQAIGSAGRPATPPGAAFPPQPGAYQSAVGPQSPMAPVQISPSGVGGPAGSLQGVAAGALAPSATGVAGWSGAPLAGGAGGLGLGMAAVTPAPVPIRSYLGQPGIAGTGLGPVQTGGAGMPLITTSTGVQLASTGYGATAQSFGLAPYVGSAAYVGPGPQPSVVNPAWTLGPPISGSYGSLGPPYSIANLPSAAPAPGVGGPTPIGPGTYAPEARPAPAPAAGARQSVPEPYSRARRSYWFKLGKGGYGTPTTPPP